MFSKVQLASLAALAISVVQVQAHGTITAIKGANGINGQGFGIIASTPRNGALPVPFEQDTSIIRDLEINTGKTGVCGRTKAGGNNDVAEQLSAASQGGLPSASADGLVTMTLHQVNQDGAGPYTCDVSGDGGATFNNADVVQNVPGFASLSPATATDFTLVAKMPTGMACTAGPNGDGCIMRCRNSAISGPFGSCVAVTNGQSTSNTTAVTDEAAESTNTASSSLATGTATGSGTDSPAAAAGDDDATDEGTGIGAGIQKAASGFLGKLGGLGKGLGGQKKRYLSSRIIGKRDEKWLAA